MASVEVPLLYHRRRPPVRHSLRHGEWLTTGAWGLVLQGRSHRRLHRLLLRDGLGLELDRAIPIVHIIPLEHRHGRTLEVQPDSLEIT